MSNDEESTFDPAVMADCFAAQGAADARRVWLKYRKGPWEYGPKGGEKALEHGTKLVVVMPTTTTGWLKWGDDGRPVDQRVGLTMNGHRPAKREALGDLDESKWPIDDKTDRPKDPWQEVRYLAMVDPESKQVFNFATSSKGGIGAVGKLCMDYGLHMRMAPDELPVVEIGSDTYRHPSYGKVPFPTMKIVEWVDGKEYIGGVNALLAKPNGGAPKQIEAKDRDFFPEGKATTDKVEAKATKAKAEAKATTAKATKAKVKSGKKTEPRSRM
jgi:hypothetical protein